jgi:3-isopropylmalate/(R)-2-methylmalate dehydratase large subunit
MCFQPNAAHARAVTMGPLLAPGEVSICTAATNSAGRFGATDARIYLGSPATVAASAVNRRITDPRKLCRFGAIGVRTQP